VTISFYASHDEIKNVKSYIRELEGPNWSNDNASRMMDLLQLGNKGLWESDPVDLPIAFRAVIKARAKFNKIAKHYTRDEVREERYYVQGLTENDLLCRLNQFEDFLIEARKIGAKTIYWG